MALHQTKQLPLWEDERKPELVHHYIELIYRDGHRRIVDTANPDDWKPAPDDMDVWQAGFVAGPAAHE